MRQSMLSILVPAMLFAATSATAQTAEGWARPDPAQQTPAAAIKPNPPTTGNISVSQVDLREVDRIARALVAGERVPGLAVAVVQNGQVLMERGYGVTDVSHPQPIDAHTAFRLASLSKSFASALTGLLVNDGRLAWNNAVVRYVPSFRLQSEGATQSVTVADLMSHRVGLTKNAYDRDIEGNLDYPSAVQKLASAPMKCMPGECYAYQNVAFSLIGDVVFAATGNFYSDAVQARLFKPLGMNDASYGLKGIESSPRWAKPHVRGGARWRALMPKPNFYQLAPAAGVNASISDMAQWMIAQSGHRLDVLPANVLAQLHTSQVSTPTELRGSGWRRERLDSAGYGFGWRVMSYAGHPLYFHGGAVQGYRGAMAVLPDRDLGVVILWNSESALPSGLLPTILDRALDLPAVAWIPNTITGAAIPDIAGDHSATPNSDDSNGSGND
ncbi:serine hydrolase domain-containing protein [Solilutibacter silvestris]|uniref:Beta-lactamase class C and other penicillin binding protein n=1 Tax=Solilutibacter silvestris TaxID=1645665 RepID=A0A2K1PX89_9GAMM|nr:Beta-lactamase class C and other penicillin binding protein [Lysobacter silvestris]